MKKDIKREKPKVSTRPRLKIDVRLPRGTVPGETVSKSRLIAAIILVALAVPVLALSGCQIRAKGTKDINELENSISDLKQRVDEMSEKQEESHDLSSQALSALEKLDKNVRNLMSQAQSMTANSSTSSLNPSGAYSPTSSAVPGTIPQTTVSRLRSQLSIPVLIPKYIPSACTYNSEAINSKSPQSYSLVFTKSLNFTGTSDPRFESNEPPNREGEKSFKISKIFNARSYVDPDDNRYYVVITYAGNHYSINAIRSVLSKSEVDKMANSIYLPR